MTILNKEIYEAFQAPALTTPWLIHDVKYELAHIRQELAGTNGKLTVLIALNAAMVLEAIGPYLARLFA